MYGCPLSFRIWCWFEYWRTIEMHQSGPCISAQVLQSSLEYDSTSRSLPSFVTYTRSCYLISDSIVWVLRRKLSFCRPWLLAQRLSTAGLATPDWASVLATSTLVSSALSTETTDLPLSPSFTNHLSIQNDSCYFLVNRPFFDTPCFVNI